MKPIIPHPLPKGTTLDQWERYASDMELHEARVKREKPNESQFNGDGMAFKKAYSQWQMMSSCDEPNKPGYYRANND